MLSKGQSLGKENEPYDGNSDGNGKAKTPLAQAVIHEIITNAKP
jgi:hypothetical protein